MTSLRGFHPRLLDVLPFGEQSQESQALLIYTECPTSRFLMLARHPQDNVLFKRRELKGNSSSTLNPNARRIDTRAG